MYLVSFRMIWTRLIAQKLISSQIDYVIEASYQYFLLTRNWLKFSAQLQMGKVRKAGL